MKIWDYVDLDKAENKIKENTEPEIPLIAAVLATPIAPAAAPITTAAAFIAPAATPASTGTVIPTLLN